MTHSAKNYLTHLHERFTTETNLSADAVDTAVAEHRDLITELDAAGADLSTELGVPAEYAAAATAEFAAEEPGPEQAKRPQGFLGVVPFDFRGGSTRGARSRIWDPQDPRILQPHLLGLGWSVNLGAVAVKLGLIRPDDIDADVIAAIPAPVMAAARAVPAALGLAAALTLTSGWRQLPEQVAMNYTLDGRPRGRRSPKAAALVLPVVGAGLAAAPYLPTVRRDREDGLRVASIGSLVGAGVLGTSAAIVAESRGANRPGLFATAALGLGVAASAGVLIGPFSAGLRRVWHREGVR